ncbi:MAG: hypothetical protein WD356_06965 [Pseudomonadales bacterium]
MTSVTYAIVFKGEILEGFQAFTVKAHLSQLLKVDAEKMATLFSGKPVVLKRTADKKEAAKYGNALRKIGADVKVKVIKPRPEQAGSPAASQQPEENTTATPVAETDTSALSVLPNEGNLVEPADPPPPPQFDLSSYSLAENDGSPLVEPSRDVPEIELDLSQYSVADNDGSPLVEPTHEEPAPVEVPDFGLDEPGAELETIHEEHEEVHPDISGLSIADAGTDLLTAEERQRDKKAPEPPDTSNIHLETNFDS